MNAISPITAIQPLRRVARPDGPIGGVLVTFVGGPWNGQTKRYARNPQSLGCVTDAHAKGMHGLYKTPLDTWRQPALTAVTATWQDLPRT
jgi:hypothetical protein